MSDRPESLAAALAELQQHLPRIGKDTPGMVRDGKRIMYANLATVSEALLPELGKYGLSFVTCPDSEIDSPRFFLRFTLQHVSGDKISGTYPLPTSGTPQQIGSAITYARRYCLLAVTGAAPDEDDDDAQAAEQAARAQRNHDPEVRADGSATEAELERMRSGPEPGTWRATSTAENDPHYDQPEWPENRPGTSTKEQRQSIYIALGKRRIKDHKGAIGRLLRRDIDAPGDMSHNEAVSVLARVRSWDGRTEELLTPLTVERSGTDV